MTNVRIRYINIKYFNFLMYTFSHVLHPKIVSLNSAVRKKELFNTHFKKINFFVHKEYENSRGCKSFIKLQDLNSKIKWQTFQVLSFPLVSFDSSDTVIKVILFLCTWTKFRVFLFIRWKVSIVKADVKLEGFKKMICSSQEYQLLLIASGCRVAKLFCVGYRVVGRFYILMQGRGTFTRSRVGCRVADRFWYS